jgi:membrane-bound metal-dependent hydrolase YbcI (DUF457 family)
MVQTAHTVSEPEPLSPSAPAEWSGLAAANVDSGFKYRLFFLLAVVLAYTGKLLLLPSPAAAHYELASSVVSLDRYFQCRAVFVMVISAVYAYSYLRDWYFERVALVFLALSVTALLLDYFTAYAHLSLAPPQWIVGLIGLRFLAIFCLLMNAMNARHAPPMPRRLWS